jgi:hypothetical protein
MEFLRNLWDEARQQLYLWILGTVLLAAITAAMGLRGTFSEKAHSHDKRGARAEAGSQAGKKPVIPADWPSARTDSGGH